MTIQYCSDLHLEFPNNRAYLRAHPIRPVGEILLLAGDITPFTEIEKAQEFFDFVSANFEHTFWIPGNHEYYHSDMAHTTGTFQEKMRSNVSLLNNTSIRYKDVRLVFSTLWSKIDVTKERVIKKSMADFHWITFNGKKISVDDYNRLHDECRLFISNEIQADPVVKTVVVSHHLPTFLNYPEKYRFSELNSAFVTELVDMVEASNAGYWIFGHSHEVVPDFIIGKTTLTTNQLGYVEHGEHAAFLTDKAFDL